MDLQKIIYNFDYRNCEIKVKPIIKVLNEVKAKFGNFIYSILIKMLEINPEDRISFMEIIYEIDTYISYDKEN